MLDKEIYKNVQAKGIDGFARYCEERYTCPPHIDPELCKHIDYNNSCFRCWKNYIEKKIAPYQEQNN